jgi:uncharacterized membrane protein YfcA
MAVGTDLACAFVTQLAGTWQHYLQGTVERRLTLNLAYGSIPACLAAIGLVYWLKRSGSGFSDVWLQRAIGAMLVVAATLIVHRVVQRRLVATIPNGNRVLR